ncbi:MAG: UDP-3-O-(3-hydroxymyristoyl)glucosamine N-acyltransferase [bacterium]|nr:UDP-3-O-(3-hydroxymyristoyl)glucosamine N-acyltransferase [bacterium]
MPATLSELAALVGGRIVGDSQTLITSALPLRDAEPGCITLVDSPKKMESERGRLQILESQASAVVVPAAIDACQLPQLIADDTHVAFAKVIGHLRGVRLDFNCGVDATARIDPSVEIGASTTVMAGVTMQAGVRVGARCKIYPGVHLLEDCQIGDDCVVYPNVVMYPNTKVGNRVVLHAGVVLGADGFGYRQQSGQHVKSSQLGWVEIEDDVEIGANSAIDRGTYGATRVGVGTKIDNLVHIAHNCHVGSHNLVCAQVGIAGSSSTGNQVILAGQVGVADHVHLHDRSIVSAQSGIMRDVEEGQVMLGSPALPSRQKMHEHALVSRLPQLRQDLKNLAKQVAALEARLQAEPNSSRAA